jgi:hypothetical protein
MGLGRLADTLPSEELFLPVAENHHDDSNEVQQEAENEPSLAVEALLDGDVRGQGARKKTDHDVDAEVEESKAVRHAIGSRRRKEGGTRLDVSGVFLRIGKQSPLTLLAVGEIATALVQNTVPSVLHHLVVHRTMDPGWKLGGIAWYGLGFLKGNCR